MEYILQNTDLFDEEIGIKFSEAIKSDKEKFDTEKIYKLTVSFHVNLTTDSRIETFFIPEPSVTNKGSKEDKMYDVMRTQLKRVEHILIDNGIEPRSKTIQGDFLDAENIIKIEIKEDTSEPIFTGKGKNRRRVNINVTSVIPSFPGTRDSINKAANERIVDIYFDFMKIIKSKKIMAEILGIDETHDEAKLVMAFAEQYGDLWLATREQQKELLNRFKERGLSVLGKYLNEKEKTDKEQPV